MDGRDDDDSDDGGSKDGRPNCPNSEDGDYDVGYGKPPKDYQFPKGVSGNPKGRPKKSREASIDALSIVDADVPIRKSGKKARMHAYEASLRTIVQKALKEGNVSAALEFVKTCEKHGLFKKPTHQTLGGVIIEGSEEWKEYIAQQNDIGARSVAEQTDAKDAS